MPTAKLREKVNEGIADPALPGKYITARLQADHIVSIKNIAKMENFDKLTKEQQLTVLIIRFIYILKNPNSFTLKILINKKTTDIRFI